MKDIIKTFNSQIGKKFIYQIFNNLDELLQANEGLTIKNKAHRDLLLDIQNRYLALLSENDQLKKRVAALEGDLVGYKNENLLMKTFDKKIFLDYQQELLDSHGKAIDVIEQKVLLFVIYIDYKNIWRE